MCSPERRGEPLGLLLPSLKRCGVPRSLPDGALVFVDVVAKLAPDWADGGTPIEAGPFLILYCFGVCSPNDSPVPPKSSSRFLKLLDDADGLRMTVAVLGMGFMLRGDFCRAPEC